MENTIHNILASLNSVISTEIIAANDRATAAEARFEALVKGLKNLAEESQPRSKGNPPTPDISKLAPSAGGKSRRVSDEALLSVLSEVWIGAAKLRQALAEQCLTLSEGSIYNRMRKLAATHPDVESAAKPERWRIKRRNSSAAKPVTLKRLSKGKPKPDADGKKSKHPPKATPTNDNPLAIHYPRLHHGNCLKLMSGIAPSSVDLILADLPYGVTRMDGDVQLPLDELWEHYRRVLKPHGTVVLFASQPFTTKLAASNLKWLKYALVWEKNVPTGFLHAATKPLKSHEDVLIFSRGTTTKRSLRRMTYNPQGVLPAGLKKVKDRRTPLRFLNQDRINDETLEYEASTNCPRSILRFGKDAEHHHPFQKPVKLLEYLIRTYSNPGGLVLDNTMGSGSTCVAAMRTGRRSVGIEKQVNWFDIAEARIEEEKHTFEIGGSDPAMRSDTAVPAVAITPATKTSDMTLYQGDCLEVMRSMPSGSVDMVFTSPPYNLGVSSGGGMKSSRKHGLWKNAALANGYASYNDARDPAEYVEWQKDVLRECWRLLSDDGAIFYQHKPRIQNKVVQTPLDLNPGLPVRQIVIWNRKAGHLFNRAFFLPVHEWVVIFAKRKFRLKPKGYFAKDVWTIDRERNNPHPAPFPVELPRTAIEATDAKVILDPFCGSGTTGVAAVQCGREFIGIELDPGYLATAKARIEKARIDAEGLRLAA